MTTHAYQKLAGHPCLHRSTFQSLLAHRREAARAPTENEPWPRTSGRGIGIRRTPRASYVLHKDPDGSWFIDQLKQDAASDMRPMAAPTQARDEASVPAANHAELCFIIEIS